MFSRYFRTSEKSKGGLSGVNTFMKAVISTTSMHCQSETHLRKLGWNEFCSSVFVLFDSENFLYGLFLFFKWHLTISTGIIPVQVANSLLFSNAQMVLGCVYVHALTEI